MQVYITGSCDDIFICLFGKGLSEAFEFKIFYVQIEVEVGF